MTTSDIITTCVLPHVETLAQQTLTAYRQHQRTKQQQQQDLTRQKDEQAIAALRALLETEIDADLLTALHVRYEVHHDRNDSRCEAIFTAANADWRLFQEPVTRYGAGWQWVIRASRGNVGPYQHDLSTSADPLALQTTLLIALGERYEQLAKAEQDNAEHEQRRAQARADERAREEREQQERRAALAQATQEDARLRAEIEALKQQALAAMWRWPHGVQIVLYHLTYTSAVTRGEEGGIVVEEEYGWTTVDHLDDNGYICIQADNDWSTESSDIKLDPVLHMPIWRRVVVRCIEELPPALREAITVSIPHVVSRYDALLDGTPRLVRVDHYGDEDYAYSERAGDVPLPWVQALLEQAAHTSQRPSSPLSKATHIALVSLDGDIDGIPASSYEAALGELRQRAQSWEDTPNYPLNCVTATVEQLSACYSRGLDPETTWVKIVPVIGEIE